MAYVHPRGAAFDFSGVVSVTTAGAPVTSMAGWTVAAKVRLEAGGYSQTLTAVWLDAAERLVRVTSPSTAAWPAGQVMHLLLRFTSPEGAIVDAMPGAFMVGAGFDDA